MRGHAEEIKQAMSTLGIAVAEQLSPDGWQRRMLDDSDIVTLTRTMRNGVLAVVQIDRPGWRWPDDWPIDITVCIGVNFEPALNLMPLVTLPTVPMLIDDPDYGRGHGLTVTIEGTADTDHAVRTVVEFVREHGTRAAARFADGSAIDAELQRMVASASTERDENGESDPLATDYPTRLRMLVLASMGNQDEARTLLDRYSSTRDTPISRADRRLIRQLNRRLDAGCPASPPIEETLAQLPRRPRPRPLSLANARAKSKAEEAAIDTARAQAQGKSLEQLVAILGAALDAQGISAPTSIIEAQAEMLQLERLPFGHVRKFLWGLGILTSGGRDMVRLFRNRSRENPEWLRPPERASYPIATSPDRRTVVELDEGAGEWLARAHAAASRHLLRAALVDVWLGQDGDRIVAHIGARRVGLIQEDTERFDETLRAAAIFDEEPVVRGDLFISRATGAHILELPLPVRR